MLNYKIYLRISSNTACSKHQLNNNYLSLRRFCSFNKSTDNQTSALENSSSISELDLESYQFNEQLIRRIKQSSLFNVEFLNVKSNLSNHNQPQIILSPDVQKYIPSVSKVIAETMTEESLKVLEVWKAKMISKLGLSGFQKYQNDLFSKGKRLHKNIEYKLKQEEENIKIDEDINGFWNSLQPVLVEIKEVHLIEEKLSHPRLLNKGIVDCVAKVNKTNTVVDWKTSEKVKDTKTKLYDGPIQTVAYLGAINQSNLIDFELDRISVVVAYSNGRAANYHQLESQDCHKYWIKWTQKLEKFWIKYLSSSPVDSCLISVFDDLLALSDETNKKIHHFQKFKTVTKINSSNRSGWTTDERSYQELNTKKYKTKDELIELLRKKKPANWIK